MKDDIHNLPNRSDGNTGKFTKNNPNIDFSSLGLTDFQDEVTKRLEEGNALENRFPVEVFPAAIQDIITATNESLNFPVDFIGASLLYAVSVAIGNSFDIEIKKGWTENAVLYLSLVGRAGTNKSHPPSFALRPIENRDSMKFQAYQKKMREHEVVSALSKKERESQGYTEPIKPTWEQLLVTDFTQEAITDVLKYNRRGIGVFADELATWFNNFNRYSKGSEEQFWLSNWSGKPIRVNRKTTEPAYITKPFISVAGTIQPGVLNELAANRTENGFMDRLLFVFPDNLKKEYWSEKELSPAITQSWEGIVTVLLNFAVNDDEVGNPKPETLRYTPEAKQHLFQWQRQHTDLYNRPENEATNGIYAKVEVYAVRLALCIQMAFYACNEGGKDAVGLEALQGALKLVEYFKKSALKVHSKIADASPLDKLPSDKQNFYNALPDSFTTNEGLNIASGLKIPERSVKRFLSDRTLFDKPKHGNYEKRI